MDRTEKWWLGSLAFLFVAAIVTLVAMAITEGREQDKCRDQGGVVERYNVRTTYVPMSCGSGCTFLSPVQSNEWRCVMPEQR